MSSAQLFRNLCQLLLCYLSFNLKFDELSLYRRDTYYFLPWVSLYKVPIDA